jgi:hypothetical protein
MRRKQEAKAKLLPPVSLGIALCIKEGIKDPFCIQNERLTLSTIHIEWRALFMSIFTKST